MTRIPKENVVVGWRCFHCGEYFNGKQRAEAAEHFGTTIDAVPACKLREAEGGLVGVIRRQSAQLHGYQEDDTALHRALYALQSERQQDLRRAEEQGYERGLRDRQWMPWGDFAP